MKKLSLLLLFFVAFGYCNAQVDSSGLDKVFGRKGTVTGNVYRVTFPRSDLKIIVGDFSVAPGLALTSWVALDQMGSSSMMMGDLCMLDSEEPAVVAKLVELGLGITAIHNHLVGEKPAIKFLHFSGSGDAVALAAKINQVFAVTATPIHNHMLHEDPRLFMLHFWGVGNPGKLAAGLKAALDKTNSKR